MTEEGEVPISNEETVAIHSDGLPSEEDVEGQGVPLAPPPQQAVHMSMPFLRILILGASFVIAFYAMLNCHSGCKGDEAYAMSVGIVSLVVILVFMFVDRKGKLPDKSSLMLTLGLFLWWSVATLYLTNFSAEYRSVGNPWFACWVAFFASLMMLISDVEHVKDKLQNLNNQNSQERTLSMLAVFSAIEFFSAAAICMEPHMCRHFEAWALICGAISFVMAVLTRLSPALQSKRKIVGIFFVCLWIGGALTTFKGPFMDAGNGYIAVWGSMLISLVYMLGSFDQPANN